MTTRTRRNIPLAFCLIGVLCLVFAASFAVDPISEARIGHALVRDGQEAEARITSVEVVPSDDCAPPRLPAECALDNTFFGTVEFTTLAGEDVQSTLPIRREVYDQILSGNERVVLINYLPRSPQMIERYQGDRFAAATQSYPPIIGLALTGVLALVIAGGIYIALRHRADDP